MSLIINGLLSLARKSRVVVRLRVARAPLLVLATWALVAMPLWMFGRQVAPTTPHLEAVAGKEPGLGRIRRLRRFCHSRG